MIELEYWLNNLLHPPDPQYSQAFFSSLLTVSGVLFGLAFAGLLFILQGGFASFKYSRQMFLRLYLHFGRQILYTLAYLTFIPFVALYFPDQMKVGTYIYTFFALVLFKATLDHAREDGYMMTLHSKCFVPRHYGPIRSYFRFIRNRGFFRNIFHLSPVIVVLAYPYLISYTDHSSLVLTEKALVYSCLLLLLLSLLRVTFFIPEYYSYQEMEIKYDVGSDETKLDEETKQRNLQAKQALKAYLQDRQVKELDLLTPVEFLGGELQVQLIENSENHEAFFNISVTVIDATPSEIRDGVLKYAFHFFELLNCSEIDINQFVLSFHIDVGDGKSRNVFIRTKRQELDKVFSSPNSTYIDILGFENYLFDPLLKP